MVPVCLRFWLACWEEFLFANSREEAFYHRRLGLPLIVPIYLRVSRCGVFWSANACRQSFDHQRALIVSKILTNDAAIVCEMLADEVSIVCEPRIDKASVIDEAVIDEATVVDETLTHETSIVCGMAIDCQLDSYGRSSNCV